MALQVWLPLNGNLKNKGLGKVTNNLTTGVVNDNGKFGKCYACKSGAYLSFNYTLETTSDFSLAFWVKVPSTITTAAAWQAMLSFSTNTGSDTTTPISWASYNQMKIYDDSAHQHAWLTIEYDTWLHFVITNRFSNGTNYAQIFKNGVLLGTYTSTTELKIRSGLLALGSGINATYGPIYYNDVRIYDNCLNNVDVQELYWGKVLEFTPQWVDNARIADASGFNFPLTPYNITVTGNEAKFNGSSSYIQFNGLNLKSGGTVSIWANLPAKPNVQRIYYCDPSSKMIVGYLAGGTILTAANNASKPSYQSTGITWKNMHHIVAVYGNDRQPSALYVNGVQPATGTSSVWTNSGEIASIGRRLGTGTADYLSGSVNEVKVFSTQLTAAEVKDLYKKGPSTNSWNAEVQPMWRNMEIIESSGATWLKVMHHNSPKTNLFTAANCMNNEDENLFSKLYMFSGSTLFQRNNGTYEFMVHERISATTAEQTFRWTQTSNPTAATCTGYKLVSQTIATGRDYGLVHQNARTYFDNKASWWCACGSYTAYQGGIPGFGGVVNTGYIDLYVRIDGTSFLGMVIPDDYVRLEYIENISNSCIDTGIKFNAETDSFRIEFKGNDTQNNGMILASASGKYFWMYYYGTNGVRVYADNGNGQQGTSYLTSDLNKHIIEWSSKRYYADGVDKGTLTNTYTDTTNNVWLFTYSSSISYPFKGRIYYADIKRGTEARRVFIPVKRKTDSAVGMYDLVTKAFFGSRGDNFTAGPEI